MLDCLWITGNTTPPRLDQIDALPLFSLDFSKHITIGPYRRCFKSKKAILLTEPTWNHLSKWRLELPGHFWKQPNAHKLYEWWHLLGPRYQITRADFRWDYYPKDDGEKYNSPYTIQTIGKGRPLSIKNYETDGIYTGFAAGKDELRYKWYNKAHEQKIKDFEWWRWEATIRGQQCKKLFHMAWERNITQIIQTAEITLLGGHWHTPHDNCTDRAWFLINDATEPMPRPGRTRPPFDPHNFIVYHCNALARKIIERLEAHQWTTLRASQQPPDCTTFDWETLATEKPTPAPLSSSAATSSHRSYKLNSQDD